MAIDPRDGMVVATNLSQAQRRPPDDPEPPTPGPRSRWILFALSVLVPAAIAITLVSALVGQGARVDCDLQLITPTQARSGALLPVRALFYTGLQSIEGPRLSPTRALVEVIDSAQQRVISKPMTLGLGNTLEATLQLPASLRGPTRVRVTAGEGDAQVVVERACTVNDAAPMAAATPRPLRPLQQFSAGPVRREREGVLPAALDVQMIGGACAPELPCEVLIHVGDPAAVITVEPYAALDLITAPKAQASPDVVRAVVRMHGPEAELRLAASIAGEVVARRWFRLAVAQAMLPIATASVVTRQQPVMLTRDSGDAPCIIDAFHEERWVLTQSFEHCDRVSLPDLKAVGLWRVQTRDDAFGGDAGAVRLIYVRDQGDSDAAILKAIAGHVVGQQRDDLMGHRILERADTFAERDFAGYSAWLLSIMEDRLIALPQAVSSYPAALEALAQKRSRLRTYCLVALLLSAIAAVSLVARRGLRASARARDIMGDAGDPDAHSRARSLRMTLTVIASASALAIAFLAIAIYVIARG